MPPRLPSPLRRLAPRALPLALALLAGATSAASVVREWRFAESQAVAEAQTGAESRFAPANVGAAERSPAVRRDVRPARAVQAARSPAPPLVARADASAVRSPAP